MNSQDLVYFAHALAEREDHLATLSFCYDVYLDFNENGREPTPDMDAAKATEQLLGAVARVLGLTR